MERADVVIVGGGFAGLCAARALSRWGLCPQTPGSGLRLDPGAGPQAPGSAGPRIVLLEARTGADPRFRGELIHPPGVRILAGLGLHAPLLEAGGAHVEGFSVLLENGVPPIVLPYTEVRGGAPRGIAISHPEESECVH